MARTRIVTLTCIAALAAACDGQRNTIEPSPASDACTQLVTLALPGALPHAEILHARVVPADEYLTGEVPAHPAFCRVEGVARPTFDSEIRFVVAIPVGDAWNGRYRQLGNGGFAGMVPEDDIVAAVARGDAAAGTDDGHASTRAIDVSWALGHPEKVVDFGWRAVHVTHDLALALITAYRGRPPRARYFHGCSDGGREGLMEAQRFPADFDGIVAGAPASDATRLLAWFAVVERELLATASSYIPAAKLQAIEAAALAACAAPGDDGVIADPLTCHFDPRVLACAGAEDDHCLNDAQITALRAIYESHDAALAPEFHGLEPGAEAEPGSWAAWVIGTGPGTAGRAALLRFASTFFRYVVFADPAYDVVQGHLDHELAGAARLSPILDATSPDLDAFAHRGGKLLVFHGWNDPAVPPRSSIAYYNAVRARRKDTALFYRLFLVPGLLHCDGGRGPEDLPLDDAVEAWVEHDTVPAQIFAKTAHGATWRLAPYPERALRLP